MDKINNLSVIILTKNEGASIEQVLKNVAFAEEIIVVDNGSTDDTKEKAEKAGAFVFTERESNFSKLRNLGAQKAKNEWLLYLDTDEKPTDELVEEMKKIIVSFDPSRDHHAYILDRNNYYLGRRWPMVDGMTRLIYKSYLKEWFGSIHETAAIEGTVGILQNRVIHQTHENFEDMVIKTNDWSEIEAKLRFEAKHPQVKPWRVFRMMITGFIHSYVYQKGYTVGTIGLLESMYQSFSYAITYCKLWELQEATV